MISQADLKKRWTAPNRAALTRGSCALAFALVLPLIACGDGGTPALTRLMEARRLSEELAADFAKSSDAANRAVMAETDQASATFAAEAEQASTRVSRTLVALEPLVAGLDFAEEVALLKKFRAEYARVVTIDREILGLAVENTNIKAQRLSFGSAYDAANRLSSALEQIVASNASADVVRARPLALTVLLRVRELELLYGPHIAEGDNAAMTKLEQQMSALLAGAREALDELARAGAGGRSLDVEPARAALADFVSIHDEIIKLSRRNSDVHSLALTLGEKRTLIGVCEAILAELRQSLMERSFPAHR